MKVAWIVLGVIAVLLVMLAVGAVASGMMGYGWGRGMMGNVG